MRTARQSGRTTASERAACHRISSCRACHALTASWIWCFWRSIGTAVRERTLRPCTLIAARMLATGLGQIILSAASPPAARSMRPRLDRVVLGSEHMRLLGFGPCSLQGLTSRQIRGLSGEAMSPPCVGLCLMSILSVLLEPELQALRARKSAAQQ